MLRLDWSGVERRNLAAIRLALLMVVAAMSLSASARAQDSQLSGSVRNSQGETVAAARIRAIATGIDTIVRTNDRGEYRLLLPAGKAQVAISAFGYEALNVEVTITGARTVIDFQLKGLARQIAEFQVRDRWMGIRGVVGDDSTRLPLAGVEITIPQARARIVTDSLGRFEVPVSINDVVLQVQHKGYQSRRLSFAVDKNAATDVMVLLKPGQDVKGEHIIMRDMEIRMKLKPLRNFVMGNEMLTRGGGKSIYDAIMQSGLMARNGLVFGDTICILQNGLPLSGFTINTIAAEDIEFIEVYAYGADISNSLRMAMAGARCSENFTAGPKRERHERKRVVEYIAIWTRK